MKTQSRISNTQSVVMAGLLVATGIVIPMFMPKIVLEPASFTLASHVPIFLAMFISPMVAISVALGTTLGFLMSGLPIIVVIRAFSHIVFACFGSLWLSKYPINTVSKSVVFAVATSAIHAACEFVVVTIFYFGGNVSLAFYDNGFFKSVVILVLVGTFVHSLVDFVLSYIIAKPLVKSGVKLRVENN